MSEDRATLKEWFDLLDFDYDTGKLIVWNIEGEVDYFEGMQDKPIFVASGREYILMAGIMTRKFDTGFGLTNAPHFIAYDKDFIYLPAQYDGHTWAYKVARDSDYYLTHYPPYEGGG